MKFKQEILSSKFLALERAIPYRAAVRRRFSSCAGVAGLIVWFLFFYKNTSFACEQCLDTLPDSRIHS